MKYNKKIILKDGRECCLRNGTEADGQSVYDNFNLTHEQTDFLLSYPDENSMNAEEEAKFLAEVGCQKLQGYLFSKPIPKEDLLNLINEGKFKL